MQDQVTKDMTLEAGVRRMKDDWNSRAVENAKWYINTVGVEQSDEEFFASGLDELEKWWLPDFREAFPDRDLRNLRVFEMGCGIGRMTSHLASVFGEVWAVDVSGEMIAQARSRFRNLNNIRWIETQGVDLPELPEDFFDLGFSIYVYQHMPEKDAIAANIAAAYRKLKRGGVYKFHTNGLENPEYEALEKDTWVGASFPEAAIREISRRLGGQLQSMQGSGTQYCWTTLRKPLQPSATFMVPASIDIRYVGRADNVEDCRIPVEGDDASICLIVSGIDREQVDCNNARINIGSFLALPVYAGPLGARHVSFVREENSGADWVAIEARIPAGALPGKAMVTVECSSVISASREIEFVRGAGIRPKIVTIRNGGDYGTDVYVDGPRSLLNLYVEGLDESASVENVSVELNGLEITPQFVGFVPENGTWQVNAQLPREIQAGNFTLVLHCGERASESVDLRIRKASASDCLPQQPHD